MAYAYNQKKSSVKHYFQIYEEYSKKYPKIALFYELGGFYEMFGIENDQENIGNLTKITQDLDIALTRCNKKILENSWDNPLFAGFPSYAVEEYIKKLIKLDYNVIIFSQYDDPNNNNKKIRKLDRIVSKGTYIENIENVDANEIMLVYIVETIHKDIQVLNIAISTIDVSTGKSRCYYIGEEVNDAIYISTKIIHTSFVSEIILCGEKINLEYYRERFELVNNSRLHKIHTIDKTICRISYQEDFLRKVFPKTGKLSPIEYLDLEKYPQLVLSLILLLQFVYEHDESILEKIAKPIIKNHKNIVQLSHRTISQLNVIKSEEGKSLFDIINKTSTAMGRRLLQLRLLSPINDVKQLNKHYTNVEQLLNNKKYVELENFLNNIKDLERLHRRILLSKLHPSELFLLNESYNSVLEILKMDITKEHLTEKTIEEFKIMIKYYNERIIIDEVAKYKINDIITPIFKQGLYQNIDNEYDKIKKGENILNNFKQRIDTIFGAKIAKIKYTITDGHYIIVPPGKLEKIKENIEDITVKKMTSCSKIFNNDIINTSKMIEDSKKKISSMSKDIFIQLLKYMADNFCSIMSSIAIYIANIDVIKSTTKTADMYKYCKPIIKPLDNKSYISTKGLRHPIVEKINQKEIFTPFNIDIGYNMSPPGLLIYGLNGSGKSILLKSIGLSVILAQAGLYVPAESFEYYPFLHIMTKISMTDNIYLGRSTFECEMIDLSKMLEKSSPNILILADELCSGTETNDALSLVGSAIYELVKKGSNFIFTSHLHQLMDIELVKNLIVSDDTKNDKGLKCYHFPLIIKDGKISYTRQLLPGTGSVSYGIEVARMLGVGYSDFIKNAIIIRKTILSNSKQEILTTKQSKYNKDIYMQKCVRCGNKKDLHTHHIIPQKNADEFGMIGHIHKDHPANLEILCKNCHKKHHYDEKSFNLPID
jgi:DNA mismatch repair protein MutS